MHIVWTIIIYPIVEIIEVVFVLAQKLFQEPGISIIAVSAAISVMCLPLYTIAEKWRQTERDTQKQLKPKIDRIKTVFSGDEQYMILSACYRQNNYHPVYALRGTFGLLIQIPFFIAAYSYLSNLNALSGIHFLFIPDLGKPDNFARFGDITINLLPLAMTLLNIIAGAVYLRESTPQEKIQIYGMAAIFLVLLYNSPAGLVLYWTLNNVFSLLKNIYNRTGFKYKQQILFLCITAASFFLIYYVMFLHRSGAHLRWMLSLLIFLIPASLWIIPLLGKITARLPSPSYSKNEIRVMFFLSLSALCLASGFFLPSSLIASSPQEFFRIDQYTTPLHFIFVTFSQALGLFVFWPVCLFLLFSERIQKRFALFFVVLFAGSLANIFFFQGNYGTLTLDMTFSGSVRHSSFELIKNIFILAVAGFVITVIFIKKGFKIIAPFTGLCAVIFAGISFYNIIQIQNEFDKSKEFIQNNQTSVSELAPIFNLSKTGKNIVVIMLDRATSSFFPYILAEHPDIYKEYSDFVYYPDTLSFNAYTLHGAPPLFGGYEYIPEASEKRRDKQAVLIHNEALLLMPRIFSEAGFDVVVTDPPNPNYSFKEDLRIYESLPDVKALITDGVYNKLWLDEHDIRLPSQSATLERNMLWYSLFRMLPLMFRDGIYQFGRWFSSFSSTGFNMALNGYAVLDYLPRLTGFSPEKENTLTIMVNNTTHEPFFYEAPDFRLTLNPTDYGTGKYAKEKEYHGNVAAILRIADWLSFLKKENVYDNTRIIITADHGIQRTYVNTIDIGGVRFNLDGYNPLLLIKNFNENFNENSGRHKDLTISDELMTNADVPYFAMAGVIAGPVNPFTGKEITIERKKKPLYIFESGILAVHDSIFNPKNWSRAVHD
jgi:YidC/Oxa1 family membrane protein insertase